MTLPARSCLIDGEAIVGDESGLAVSELIRHQRPMAGRRYSAFDLLEDSTARIRSAGPQPSLPSR
jgi:ATP-dependent DNA ligase